MIGQTTTATPGIRDATPPVQGGARDFLLVTIAGGLVLYFGLSDACAQEVTVALAAKGGALIGGVAGLSTVLRKIGANARAGT